MLTLSQANVINLRPTNVQKESPAQSFGVFLFTLKEEFHVTSNFVTIYQTTGHEVPLKIIEYLKCNTLF
jgi:hypothetical protein